MHKNVVFLCQNNLYNKTRGSSKRKKASFEELGNFAGFEKGISRRNADFLEFEMMNIRSDKTAYCKITDKTMFKIVMLMRDFVFGGMAVVAFFFGKLLSQMLETVHGLKQHCKQYRNCQEKIDYDKFLFHPPQR